MKQETNKSQRQFILEYFEQRALQEISHSISKKEIEEVYFKEFGKRIEDVDRAIRKLHQEGFLIKVRKGVYMYDPDAVNERDDLEDFAESTKQEILKRDGYKCVICGLGKNEGLELQIDHIVPKNLGGKATAKNGQTLCSKHNFQKKTLGQVEFAKKIFIRIYNETRNQTNENSKLMHTFSAAVLRIYEEFEIDDHVKWHR